MAFDTKLKEEKNLSYCKTILQYNNVKQGCGMMSFDQFQKFPLVAEDNIGAHVNPSGPPWLLLDPITPFKSLLNSSYFQDACFAPWVILFNKAKCHGSTQILIKTLDPFPWPLIPYFRSVLQSPDCQSVIWSPWTISFLETWNSGVTSSILNWAVITQTPF